MNEEKEGTMGRMGTTGRGRTIRWLKSMVVTVAVAAALGTAPGPARAAEQYASDFGMGIGTVFVNIFYMPVKVVYAALGGLTGGFAYVLTGGRMDTASAVWRPSLGGTYVVTPSMLRGEDPIYFSGVTVDDRARNDEQRDRDGRTPRDGY